MTDRANEALSPAGKAARTRAAFLHKVELMEEWADTGSIDGGWFPKTVAELARWKDERLETVAWGRRNIVSDPKYRDLRGRFEQAKDRLLARTGKRHRGGDEAARRAVAEKQAVIIAQQLVAERLAHQETRKRLRLALANADRRVPVAGDRTLRVVGD